MKSIQSFLVLVLFSTSVTIAQTGGEKCKQQVSLSALDGNISAHDYVDLGLPSGVMWATCNVGASSPASYGDYYAWGETKVNNVHGWEYLKYCNDNSGDSFSKYNEGKDTEGTIDGKTTLDSEDDAAHVNWGGSWRMPTKEEWMELRNSCDWEWYAQDDYKGFKVTSKANGHSIFLPAAGWIVSSLSDAGGYGYYWSSSLDASYSYYAYYCYFNSDYIIPANWFIRYYGFSVRPVSSAL